MLENRLRPVQIDGQPVRFSPPKTAFRFLGVEMTVDLNWATQAANIQKRLHKQAAALLRSPLAAWRKELVMRTVIMAPAVEYGIALCPYSPIDLPDTRYQIVQKLDSSRSWTG